MVRTVFIVAVALALGSAAMQKPTPQQGFAGCIENSPERQGKTGCTILEDKSLPEPIKEPVYWHIDRFDALQDAKAAAGPASVAAEAHGAAWLMSVEAQTSDHRGGKHITQIGPLPLPQSGRYSMQVMSALFAPGVASRVHTHPGPEAFYVIEGEQCLETPTGGQRTGAGQSHIIPADVPMRVVATGKTVRRALALILHDVAHPPIHIVADPAPLVQCK